MGHRFSKTAANNLAAAKTSTWKTTNNNNNNNNTSEQLQAFHTTTNIIPIPNGRQQPQQAAQFVGPTINLQIQESPNITDTTGAHCIGATTSINSLTTTAAVSSSILQIPQQQQQYNTNSISSSSLTSVNNLSCGGRQIIIKIQLAKMENGNETTTTATTTTTMAAAAASSPSVQYLKDTSLENLTADCNLNSTESSSSTVTSTTAAGSQVLNLTLNSGNSSCNSNSITATTTTAKTIPTAGLTSLFPSTSTFTTTSSSASTSTLYRTAGSSLNKNNNNNYFNTTSMGNNNNNNNSISSCSVMPTTSRFERPERLNSSLQFNDEIVEQNIGEIVEYCEVLEQQQLPNTSSCNNTQMLTINEETDNNEPNACCRRKSKSLAANAANGSSTAGSSTNSSSSSNTGTKAKSRCRKCSCRDAFRRFLDPSLSRSSSSNKAAKQQQQKEQKRNKSQDRHSTNNNNNNNNNTNISNSLMNNNSMHSNNTNITARATTATTAIVMPSVATNQVSLWTSATATPHGNDVIIPLTTPTPPQFVVVQCAIVNASNSLPPTPNTIMSASSTSSNIPTNGLISIAHDISPTTSSSSTTNNEFKLCPNNNTTLTGSQTTVHSQVDYVHYLVPDLERITNSSFYWGKMDRYEAERLLEGKPEGTFLLRDSAQEEFLFSVTFRKYGRSLHARIEQSGHRFSFDCHDPCVFTAPTVTGLLEHYKDPACVMFFEPMLTIPLHRKNCFSLQKLCRATIVSNTTYDGINELELPARLKAYLKEYHYKQKLRVKFNEPSYTIHCK